MSYSKAFLGVLLAASLPLQALAQPLPATAGASMRAKRAPAPVAARAVPKPQVPRMNLAMQKAAEEETPVDDEVLVFLTDADLEVARQVFVGDMPCELGASVTIAPTRRDGHFIVTTKGHKFRMHPVESRTGAVRLEDPRRGAMWLQLGNKSMLMSQKLGQRLADECQSPQQITYAEVLKRNPLPSILDPLPGEAATPAALVPAVPAAPAVPAVSAGSN